MYLSCDENNSMLSSTAVQVSEVAMEPKIIFGTAHKRIRRNN